MLIHLLSASHLFFQMLPHNSWIYVPSHTLWPFQVLVDGAFQFWNSYWSTKGSMHNPERRIKACWIIECLSRWYLLENRWMYSDVSDLFQNYALVQYVDHPAKTIAQRMLNWVNIFVFWGAPSSPAVSLILLSLLWGKAIFATNFQRIQDHNKGLVFRMPHGVPYGNPITICCRVRSARVESVDEWNICYNRQRRFLYCDWVILSCVFHFFSSGRVHV